MRLGRDGDWVFRGSVRRSLLCEESMRDEADLTDVLASLAKASCWCRSCDASIIAASKTGCDLGDGQCEVRKRD